MSLFNTTGSPGNYGSYGGAESFAGFDGGGSPLGGGGEFFGRLPEEEGRRMAQTFDRCRSSHGFVQADMAKAELERTGLTNEMLTKIWELSDLDRDGRLSVREFACALHLAEQARGGYPLPHTVSVEQQAQLMRSVEAFVSPHPARRDEFGSDIASPEVRSGKGVRETAGDAFASVRGDRGAVPTDDGRGYRERLGQLALLLDAAREAGNLHRFCEDVLHVRQELEEQLARRRDYQQELRELREAIDQLRDERRVVEVDNASIRRRVAHLQDEVAFVEAELQGAEGDLVDLREATGFRGDAHDHIGGVMAERRQLEMDQASIRDLRTRLVEHSREKAQLQGMQQALVERQRHIEQDRNLTLTAIEAERTKVAASQQTRLRMCEERWVLEQELLRHGEAIGAARPQAPASGASGPRPPPTSAAGARRADHRGVRHDAPSPVLAS